MVVTSAYTKYKMTSLYLSFSSFFFFSKFLILFWLHWAFVAVCGLSLAAVHRFSSCSART